MDKEKKTILITGTSSGIGRETAVRLAQEGYSVFAGVRRKVDKAELEKLNTNIKGVYLDIANSGSIEKAFSFVAKNTKKLDVLINNAGIVVSGPIELIDIKRLKEQFDVNTFGVIEVSQKFIPLLSDGRIINISSMAATGLFPFISPYCASKRAMDILMNSFALENKNNIKVISVKPASVKTPIWNKSIKAAQNDFENLNTPQKEKYMKELLFLQKNAFDNNTDAIETFIVVDKIIEIINSKNPKASYNVGDKAIIADFISKLPLDIVNKLIKLKLKKIDSN